MTNKLPSGKPIISLFDTDESQPDTMESTASAMALDIEGQCPKCQRGMSFGIANKEQVYYCERCRVALPLSNTN